MGTLIKANTSDDDLEYFLESNVGLFLLEEGRVEAAHQAIDQLKGEAK